MKMQDVKAQAAKVFTPTRLKKVAALTVLIGSASTSGVLYQNQQAEARSAAEKQARSETIAAQASQRGMVLLAEAHVRTIAAEAIGQNESDLDFYSVRLDVKDYDDDRDGKHPKHEHKYDNDDRYAMNAQMDTTQQDFRPVYKVKCYAGNVKYKLRIDAVTGAVLSSKMKVVDNAF